MNIYHKIALITSGVLLSFVAIKVPTQAATFFEIGDAGDTLNNAQVASGLGGESLDRIEGRLESTNDQDYFRFFWGGVGMLQIETGPYFNTSFPANTFPAFQLFNPSNSLVGGYFIGAITLEVGDIGGSGISLMFGSAQFNFHYLSAGEYVLKVDGTGQANEPKPIYEGDYAIRLSGAEFIPSPPIPASQPVPEPGTLVSTLVAGGIGWLMKRKKASVKRRKLNSVPADTITQNKPLGFPSTSTYR